MTAPLKSTLGRIKIGSSVYAAKNVALNYEAVGDYSNHSALQMPTNIRIAGATVPVVSWQMYAADALAALGLTLTSQAAFEATFGNLVGALIDSSSTHTKVGLQGTPSGAAISAYIDSWSVSEGGEWMCDCKAYFFSALGDTDPVKVTQSVAFPALTAIPVVHGIGLFTANGSAVPGTIGSRYSCGLSIVFQRCDGNPFATGGAPSGYKPILSIEHADPVGLAVLLGSLGVAIASTTTLVYNKYNSSSGVLAATGAKTITIANGYIRPKPASVDQGQLFKGGCEIMGASADGSTHPFVVS